MKEPLVHQERIIQFGGGNFLRAFCDWMFQKVNRVSERKIIVTLIKPTERGSYTDLRNQNGTFHVVVEGLVEGKPNSTIEKVEVIDTIIHPYRNFEEFLKSAEDESVRMVVSNTTESGIKYSEELYEKERPAREFPGKLCQWLYHRYRKLGHQSEALIIMPTELIEQNGEVLRTCVAEYARCWNLDEGFMNWMDRTCIFVNTLVDRIVPGYSDKAFEKVKEETGISDKAVVVAEPYHSLVISSDREIRELLPFGQAGLNVELVRDLSEYRQKKVRILNGAHTALVSIGIMNGISAVIDAMNTEWLYKFVRDCLLEEVVPTLGGDANAARDYVNTTLERFGNPYLQHKLSDIALNSISKIRFRLLPSLLTFYETRGLLPKRIVFSFAHWLGIYLFDGFGKFEARDVDEVLSYFDVQKNILKEKDGRLEDVLDDVLKNVDLWGSDLTEVKGLREKVMCYIQKIHSENYDAVEYIEKLS